MSYGYYPGCYALARMPQYDLSARSIMRKLDVEIIDMSDAPCCGPAPIKSVDYRMASALSAQVLAMAEKKGLDTIVTLCPECFSSFMKANVGLEEDAGFGKEVKHLLSSTAGLDYQGGVKVKHLLQVIHDDIGLKKLRKDYIIRGFEGLKAAVHSGCHFSRFSASYHPVGLEDSRMLDELVEGLGIESVYWQLKSWCCGAPILAFDRDLSCKLGGKKLQSAKVSGADCIVSLCPYCQMQFDYNQSIIEKKVDKRFTLPVVLFTQLLGLCMGFDKKEVGLGMNRVSADAILDFME
ncbi:MAG: CoB--CoM heterodisulfide reductase iron-sulfur subunit B family protein [Candidatus Bathyarchaeota archaeon]|nr:MAG: CoB--CoM heterodisulfide reductase iron-sulfur subunit B family protein [Candidatus Bathyarchaeota archaeon]